MKNKYIKSLELPLIVGALTTGFTLYLFQLLPPPQFLQEYLTTPITNISQVLLNILFFFVTSIITGLIVMTLFRGASSLRKKLK